MKDLVQNTPEWHEFRLQGIGASEVAAILGICPWKTAHDIWLEKTGHKRVFEGNSFTLHGQEKEGRARARYELTSLTNMKPACAIHPQYPIARVSLDGISDDGKKLLEIKCPKSRKTIDSALSGKVPENYIPQVQYQLAVTGADELDFFVYFEGNDGSIEDATVHVLPEPSYQGRLIVAVLLFWEKFVLTKTPPPLTDRDVKVINDNEDLNILCDLIIKQKDSASKERLSDWKRKAIEIAGHPKMRCGRVQISNVYKDGKFSFHKLTILRESA